MGREASYGVKEACGNGYFVCHEVYEYASRVFTMNKICGIL